MTSNYLVLVWIYNGMIRNNLHRKRDRQTEISSKHLRELLKARIIECNSIKKMWFTVYIGLSAIN